VEFPLAISTEAADLYIGYFENRHGERRARGGNMNALRRRSPGGAVRTWFFVAGRADKAGPGWYKKRPAPPPSARPREDAKSMRGADLPCLAAPMRSD
jgi:hypothetical protein